MPNTTTSDFADVVLVPFPFTDQSTAKKRPAVVISSAAYHRQRPDLILMAITSQGAEAEKRIALVASEGLRADIDRLAGAPFWSQVESLHQTYGEVLGITKPKDAVPPTANVLEADGQGVRTIMADGALTAGCAAPAAHHRRLRKTCRALD